MNQNILIQLKNISKSFDGETILDKINLDIHDKEFITLLGPSGCGKICLTASAPTTSPPISVPSTPSFKSTPCSLT